MFSVIFEALRPELERVDGFVDNIRYKSLTREGWILSLSNWRDEKSLVRWRTRRRHHEVQQKGRDEILADYHRRVGQITADNQLPPGYALTEQRLDETEVGEGTTVTLINATRPAMEADQQPVRLRRVARPESVGRRQHVLGHLRRHTYARRADSPHILEGRRCSAGLRGRFRAE